MLALVTVAASLFWTSADVVQKPFPVLPSAFSAIIEANIVNKNYSTHMREYYSAAAQRVKLETFTHKAHAMSTRTTSMVDLRHDQYVHVVNDSLHGWSSARGAGVCTWGDITHTHNGRGGGIAQFAVRRDSHGPHLISSNRMFAFVNTSATRYEGTATVRGMVCDKWTYRQCFGPCMLGMGFNLEFYFTSSSAWSVPGAGTAQVPVRILLKGARPERRARGASSGRSNNTRPATGGARGTHTSMNATKARSGRGGNHSRGGGAHAPRLPMHTYEHVYDYVSFHVGEPSSHHFRQPCGVMCTSINKTWNATNLPARDCSRPACEGQTTTATTTPAATTTTAATTARPSGKEAFPTLPASYSATIEMKTLSTQSTTLYHEYFSTPHQRLAYYMHTPGGARTRVSLDLESNRYVHTDYTVSSRSSSTSSHSRSKSSSTSKSTTTRTSGSGKNSNRGGSNHHHHWSLRDAKCTWGDVRHLDAYGQMLTNSVVGYASDTPHFSTASVFGLVDGKAPPAYAGDEHVRGILCNKYTMPRRCWGKDCAFNATASFYFNDPAWRLPEDGDNARVPVRVVWEGSTTVNETTGAALDPARRVAFREVMDYVSFHVGEPTEWHFARPCGMTCQSVNKAWNAAELPAQPCSAGCPFSGGVSTTSGPNTPAPAPQIMKIPITFASKLNATHLANVKNTWCTWAAKSLELLVSDLVCDVRHSKSAQYALLVTVEKSKIKTGFAEKMEILTKMGVDELVAEFNKDPNIPTARRAEKSPTTDDKGGTDSTSVGAIVVSVIIAIIALAVIAALVFLVWKRATKRATSEIIRTYSVKTEDINAAD